MLRLFLILVLMLAADVALAQSPEAAISRSALSLLQQQYPGADLEVKITRLSLQVEGDSFRVALPREGKPNGYRQAVVECYSQGVWKRAGTAMLYVSEYRTLFAARTAIKSGMRLTPDRVHTVRTDVSRLTGEYLELTNSGVSPMNTELVATRTIKEGELIRANDLETPSVLEPGMPVVMNLRSGRIQLQVRCVARESARLGDVIRVYATDTRTTYKARILSAEQAEWVTTL